MLILASQSPRRKELLVNYGYIFKSVSPNVDESSVIKNTPNLFVETLAHIKAQSVFNRHPKNTIIAADTIVYMDNHYYEKPKNKEEAINMLNELSGKTHQVYTGVCILASNHQEIFHTVADVTFHQLDEQTIINYVEKYQPFDKAGAYGIQEQKGVLVKSYEGDYLTIVGFPMETIKTKLDILL